MVSISSVIAKNDQFQISFAWSIARLSAPQPNNFRLPIFLQKLIKILKRALTSVIFLFTGAATVPPAHIQALLPDGKGKW